MKANEFVKKFGRDKAWVCLSLCASPEDKWFQYKGELVCDQDFDDLVRLVEPYELVESMGGLIDAKQVISYPNFLSDPDVDLFKRKLGKAIADVESCQ